MRFRNSRRFFFVQFLEPVGLNPDFGGLQREVAGRSL
ncbi:hypothetical protein PHO31112_03040 [Pandoraea horticolens]|uniref:Uncharacterized protein n=1 Tax=Pandoraea horticolens TaxID=2508298 RepID=A0A5E4W6J8_9BURK|nr:hypothetical protein PHO31112_03040 [Pandoraea horticolens]